MPGPEIAATSLQFDNLPLTLDDASLRCKVVGSAGVRATELRCELRMPSAPEMATMPVDEEALRIAAEQLRGRIAFLGEEIGLKLTIGDRGAAAPGDTPMPSPLEARIAMVGALDERLTQLHLQLAEYTEELRVAEAKLEEIHAAQQLASSAAQARIGALRKCVGVALQGSAHSSESCIELEYFVPGARWSPAYALRLRSGLDGGALAMRAMVSQRTGEDWGDVTLTLSTANFQSWSDIPELTSKRIGRRQTAPLKKGWRPPPEGADELYRDYDRSFGSPTSGSTMSSYGGAVDAPVEAAPMAPPELQEDVLNAYAPPDAEFDDYDTRVMSSAEESGEYPDEELVEIAQPMPTMASPSGAIAMSAPSAPSVESSRRRSAPMQKKMSLLGGGRFEQAPSPPESISVNLDRMQYGSMRMPEPGASARGVLRLYSRMEMYSELFLEQGSDLDYSARSKIEHEALLAEDIASIPTGHQEPWSEDFDYAYRAENSVAVVSDGQYHSLPIVASEALCTPLHVVVPRENTDVFRTVRVNNPMASPLLAGPMDVYWSDDFLLTSPVGFTAPKGQVELGLGVDQGVKVVRNTHYREDTAGLMGGALELSHKIVIEVANEGAHPISLEVRERVPVAAADEDDIKLEVKSVSPEWTAMDKKELAAGEVPTKGSYRWQLSLAEGQRTELSATYEIKLPSKYELSGGNRREW